MQAPPTTPASRVPPLVEIDSVSISFGGIRALDGVSFTIEDRQIVGLIGPNGAGKTTLFNCLSLLYRPDRGDIRVSGESILRCQPHDMARLGLGRTFQNVALFDSMTVLENVMVGRHARCDPGLVGDVLGFGSRAAEQASRTHASELLEMLNLGSHAQRPAADLNFAARKKVEIARALAAQPRLLMLDEPAGGLNHEEVEDLGAFICDVRDHHQTAVLLVEHHMNLVMRVSDKLVALDFGQKIAEGSPQDVKAHEHVLAAYMGVEA